MTKNPKVFKKKAVIHDTKENEKGVIDMTDGIGRIFGGNNYGVGGYVPQRKEEDVPQNKPAQAPVNYEETQVDPSKVMDFLASNNYFVAPVETTAPGEVDEATKERVVGYMENFEMIYGVVVNEFGEENAPLVMDLVMDKLMGLAA